MTSLAATLLDLSTMPTGLKISLGPQDDHELSQRDDIFFSLMQEPEATTPQKEQEPLRQMEKTSNEEPLEKNDIACDLEKTDPEEKAVLQGHISQDIPLRDLTFPKEWKGLTKEDKASREIVESLPHRLSAPNSTEENFNDPIPQTEERVVASEETLNIELPLAKPDKTTLNTTMTAAPLIEQAPIHSAQESIPFETDLVKEAQSIDQEEHMISFLANKTTSEKKDDALLKTDIKNIEKTDESNDDLILKTDLRNIEKSAEHLGFMDEKRQDLNGELVLKQKNPLPPFEDSSFQKNTPTLKKSQDQKTPPLTNSSALEKKNFANLSTNPTSGFEKFLSTEASNDQLDELIVNFTADSATDKKIPSSETAKPVESSKPQEETSQMSSYKAVVLDIKMPSKEAPGSLKLRLDPAHLGRVEVKVHITHDGRMNAVVNVVKSETFELLQKDASALHKVIAEAFGQDESAMSFSLTGGEKNASHDFFTPPHRNNNTQNNLERAPGDQTLTYTPQPLDPARMLDALV